jgi:hypothetical protein
MTKEKSKTREKETSGPVNGQLSFWRHNSQMFSTYSDMSLRKVDSADGSDRRRDGTEQVDTASTTAKRRATACGRSDDDGDDAMTPVDERTWNKTSNVDGKG